MFSSRKKVKKAIAKIKKSRKRVDTQQQIICNLDFFVLDNSIRESTVSQLKGHTVDDKWKIYRVVQNCNYRYIIVSALSDEQTVDDVFVTELVKNGEDMSFLFSLVEFIEDNNEGTIDTDNIPISMKKMRELGIINPIIEIDLANSRIENSTINEVCQLLQTRFEWTK